MTAKPRSVWEPILPVPEDAPPAKVRHSERGDPLRIFPYPNDSGELLGYVARFMTSKGEALHQTMTWCKDQDGVRAWRWIQFQRMRPLFGLDRLAALDPEDHVMLCFDEHAADHAAKLLKWVCPMSWPGGIKKIDEVDWSPLKGRMVWIWPSLSRDRQRQRRDQQEGEGIVLPRDRQSAWQAALKLERIITGYGGYVVSVVDPWSDETRPDGWDAGMAGMQDWTSEQTDAWVLAHLSKGLGTDVQQRIRKLKGEPDPTAAEPPKGSDTPSGASAGKSEKDGWIPDLVYKNGDLSACLHNVHQILSSAPEWKGVVALDDFSLKIVKRKPPPYPCGAVGEWSETDDARTAMLLQRQYGFTPSSTLVREAIGVLADGNRYHPVRDYFSRLKWDETPRLEMWAIDHLGVADSQYARLASKWWLMGAVVRALRPGAKFDYVLVLAGAQGKKKSSALGVLGGDWFGDADLDFSNKDSMIALQGKLIFELPELGALARSDERRQKSFLSRRFDEFRPPYGRGFIKVPRQMVFAGSTNEWEWNKDPTGGRRFWPFDCTEIDLEALAEIRDQLFAEALHYVNAGERYWPTEDEQRELFDPIQLRVEQQDALVEQLAEWVDLKTGPFTLLEAAKEGCDIKDVTKLTRDIQTRIGSALHKLGCRKYDAGKKQGMARFKYKPPHREEAKSVTSQPAQQDSGGGDVGF